MTTRRAEFEELLSEHLAAAWRFAAFLTRDTALAEDVLQDAILRAYRFFDGFRPGTNFKAWLFRIIRNTMVNDHRRRRARPATTGLETLDRRPLEAGEATGASAPPPPFEALDSSRLGDDIRLALGELSEHNRSVVVCCRGRRRSTSPYPRSRHRPGRPSVG